LLRRHALFLMPLLCACASPGARYFAGDSRGCDDVRAARGYADEHSEITPDQRADALIDAAHCEVKDGHPENVEPLLAEAVKTSPHAQGAADAERAALLAEKGDKDGALEAFKKAMAEGYTDLDDVVQDAEFEKLLALPELERSFVALAASEEPVAPRVQALAEKLKQRPVTPVVVEANPDYGLNTFTVWHGRVLESHYDRDNDETTVLLEELAAHEHDGGGDEAHQHYEVVWTPGQGFIRQPHEHLHADNEQHIEYEATGRYFGLRVQGFQRELVEAPDLEVVGYYTGRTPFAYRGEQGDAPTLEVIRAVPFNSGVHLGTPVAHEH